jgi:hypothetical protein
MLHFLNVNIVSATLEFDLLARLHVIKAWVFSVLIDIKVGIDCRSLIILQKIRYVSRYCRFIGKLVLIVDRSLLFLVIGESLLASRGKASWVGGSFVLNILNVQTIKLELLWVIGPIRVIGGF